MTIPNVPINQVVQRVERFWNPHEYIPHHGLFGASRSGKSYLIRHTILPIVSHERTVVIDVKNGGALTWDGWGNDVDTLPPGFATGNDGTMNYRLMIKPGDDGKRQVVDFLEMISAEGACAIVMDDQRPLTATAPGYGLSNHIDNLLTVGAEMGITAILAANSTTWATSSLRDQCGAYWVGKMVNENELRKVITYTGLPKESLPELTIMKPRQFVYVDSRDGFPITAMTGL